MGYGYSKLTIEDVWSKFEIRRVMEYDLCREITVSGPNVYKLNYKEESIIVMLFNGSTYLIRITSTGTEINRYDDFFSSLLTHLENTKENIRVIAGICDRDKIREFLSI